MTKLNLKDVLKTPKGTRDLLPEEAAVWQKIEERAREVAEYYGFRPIRTPHIEHTELFTASLGEASDVVEKQMYSFATRGHDKLTLRPEGTAPIMRAYLEHGMRAWPQPVMLYYNGSFFRHENPQRGRYRELGQFGFEILGDESPVADAMIIWILTLVLKDLGIKNFTVRINTLGDKECRGDYKKELVQYLRKKANYLCKDCKIRLKKNPLRVLDCKDPNCAEIKAGAPQTIEYVCAACKSHFKEVLEFLDELGIPYLLDHSLVRGLDYYSRTVFEIFLDEKKPEEKKKKEEEKENAEIEVKESAEAAKGPEKAVPSIAIAGGGRYDYLGKMLSSKDIPATGGAFGLDRLSDAVRELNINLGRKKAPKLFLIQLGSHAKKKSLSLAEEFRQANIPLAMSFSRDSIGSQLKIASRLGVGYAVIIGQKEAFDETAIVRNMEAGVQETIPLPRLLSYVKNKLKSKQ
ncbi:MAG: histidine--tRNA ligase [Patescibacteria group bacterium]